jgi:hypothetical protein
MSGFEVAGIVLGGLPLVIQGIKGLISIVSSIKSAQRDLRALSRDLDTEYIRLKITCEELLVGAVPPAMIDELIQSPSGPAWRAYDDNLRLRLWSMSEKFEEEVTEIFNATEELKRKLGVGADGKV